MESFDALKLAMEAQGLPYRRQGSLASADDYPNPAFITYWQTGCELLHYENGRAGHIDRYNVYLYTCEPEQIYAAMDRLLLACEDRGFYVRQQPRDIESDRADYFGRFAEVEKICRSS